MPYSHRLLTSRFLGHHTPSPLQALPTSLVHALEEARVAFNRDDFSAALDAYHAILAEHPTCLDAYKGRGRCFEQLGDIHRAMADYDRACVGAMTDSEALVLRGNLYANHGQLERALEDFRRAEVVGPPSATLYMSLGQVLAEMGEDFEVVEAFSRAFDHDHTLVDALRARAQLYMAHECFVAALADFAMCLQLRDDEPQLFVDRGNAFYELGDFERATRDYDSALALHSQLPEVHLNLGCIALDRDQLKDALRHFDRAIAMDANYARAHLNRGLTCYFLARFPQAEHDLQRAVALDPQDPDGFFALARLYARIRRFRPAIEALGTALERCPDYVDDVRVDDVFDDLRKLSDVKRLMAAADEQLGG